MLYACANVETRYRLVRAERRTRRRPCARPARRPARSRSSRRHGRAGLRAEDRPARAAAAQPRRRRPGDGPAVVEQVAQGVLPAGRGAVRLGEAHAGAARRCATAGSLVGWGWPRRRIRRTAPPRRSRAADADGTRVVRSGTQDIGAGTYTTMTQIAADALGLPIERVRFDLGDTTLPPRRHGRLDDGGERRLGRVRGGAAALRANCSQLAVGDPKSPLQAAAPDDVEAGGRAASSLTERPGRGETYADILRRHGTHEVEATIGRPSGNGGERLFVHCLRSALRRGPRGPRPRRGPRGALRERVRGRAHPQREDGAQPAHRRHVMGIGMALLEHTVMDPRTAGSSTQNHADTSCRSTRTSRRSTYPGRRGRPAREPARRQGDRRGRPSWASRRPSPTPSTTPPEAASATCRSRPRSCSNSSGR